MARKRIQMARKRKTLMSQEAYDIVIVGAGAAGCVIASYLAEHTDASIALIEAGDMDRDPFIHIPAGFANMLAHDRNVWKYETVPQHGTKRAYRSWGRRSPGNRRLDHAEHHQRQYQRHDPGARAPRHGDASRGSEADLLSRAIEIKSEVGIGTAVRMMLLPESRPADGNSDDLSNSIATF
jgi:glycine/D-amino acid oxidase-like deaminating enzyme